MTQLRFTDKGTKGSLRARNDVLVLQCVAAGGGRFARTDIVQHTGLPAATVSEIVADLIARRLVRECGRETHKVGKPRVLLELDDTRHRFVGVQVGKGRILVSRLTLTGHIEATVAVEHPAGEDTPRTIAAAVEKLAADADGTVAGIGVALPGIVGDDGVIREAVNYGWRMVPFGEEVAKLCGGLPVHVVNDANAVALSEVALSADGDGTVVVIWIGTGVGAGIVLEGRLYRGVDFRSGEIGHVDTGASLRCRCGQIGCLETVAAMPFIHGDADQATVDRYLAGADDGEARALGERMNRAARELARLLSMLAGTLDVTDFVLGGPMATDPLGPPLLRMVEEALTLRVMSGFEKLTLRPTTLGAHSVVFGAAAHAIRQELGVMVTMPAGVSEAPEALAVAAGALAGAGTGGSAPPR